MSNPKPPKKWKMAVVVWLAIYPLITFITFFFGKYINQIEMLPLRNFIKTLVLVPIMVYMLIPAITKLLGNWLKN